MDGGDGGVIAKRGHAGRLTPPTTRSQMKCQCLVFVFYHRVDCQRRPRGAARHEAEFD